MVIGPHRADVKVGDRVIEFQHSSISAEDVRGGSRYGNMMRVFDVQEAYEAERLISAVVLTPRIAIGRPVVSPLGGHRVLS